MPQHQDDRAVQNFREYLKIRSVHPKPDYDGCINFLKKLAAEIGLKSKVIKLKETHPVIIMTLEGKSPELPSILLNSHMDVVPVFEEEWDYDPFGAFVDEEGNIFARGTQDMKSTTIGQLEAIRRLKDSGAVLKRTVHMTVLPDEEIGSEEGMEKFVENEAFKNLNIGFDLDEGGCSPDNKAIVFKNERCRWAMNIHCPGTTGHGSLLLENTAGEKARIVIDHFMDFREKEKSKLTDLSCLGDVTSINLTTLKGGVQNNVIPPELIIGFDMRISADEDHEIIENWLQNVCKKAGDGVYPEFLQKDCKVERTCHDDNPFGIALERTIMESGVEGIKKLNCYGATDARFVRKVGIPALGFTPFYNTETRLHGTNEFLNTKIFLQGISHYEKIISALANC